MTVDPKTSAILNIVITIVAAIAALGADFTTVFGEGAAKEIVSIASMAGVILGAFNTALHSISAPKAGPLVK